MYTKKDLQSILENVKKLKYRSQSKRTFLYKRIQRHANPFEKKFSKLDKNEIKSNFNIGLFISLPYGLYKRDMKESD